MKYKLILLISILLYTCKGEVKDKPSIDSKQDIPIYREVVNKEHKEHEEHKTLQSYINSKKEQSGLKINGNIQGLINVNYASLFKEVTSNKVYIVLKLTENINSDLKQTHRLIVRTFPYNESDLREDTLTLGRNYDTWYSNLNTMSAGNELYLYTEIGTLGDFKKIQIQLLEKSTKKFLKESIFINDLHL